MRSTEEIRRLLLAAAEELFVTTGYAATTTKDICAKAGVAENLLFRHFGTKATLFEHAVFHPFQAAVERFLTGWEEMRGKPQPDDFVARSFTEAVFDLLAERGGQMLLMMLTIDQYNAGSATQLRNPLLPLLDELERVTAYEHGRRGWSGVDIQVVVRAMFGMVAFNAAFEDLLYSSDARRPSRERVIAELSAFSVAGSARHDTHQDQPPVTS